MICKILNDRDFTRHELYELSILISTPLLTSTNLRVSKTDEILQITRQLVIPFEEKWYDCKKEIPKIRCSSID